MKVKTKSSDLEQYNNRHHVIRNIKNDENISNNQKSEITSILNKNIFKTLGNIGSSYLVTDNNRKKDTIFQKIKGKNEKKRKKYFDINQNNNDNKKIKKTKNTKITLKNNLEDGEIIDFENLMINDKLEIIKKKGKKPIKDIDLEEVNIDIDKKKEDKEDIKNKISKIYHNNRKNIENSMDSNNENETDNSDNEIYIYNGSNNILVKEQYENIVINNKSNTKIINYFQKKPSHYRQISENNQNFMKNLIDLNSNKSNEKIYSKKITKNSTSLSKRINKRKSIKKKGNLKNSSKKEKDNISMLNEKNKTYFKINNNEIYPKTDREFKIYSKPKKYNKQNKIYKNKSFEDLNHDKFSSEINKKNNFVYFHKFNNGKLEAKFKLNDIYFSQNKALEFEKENKKIFSKKINNENNIIFFNSNNYNPKISINKIKINFPDFQKSNDNEKSNFNEIVYSLNKLKSNNNIEETINKQDLIQLPKSDIDFQNEKSLISCSELKDKNSNLKILITNEKFNLNSNNNYIPIKNNNRSNNLKNLFFSKINLFNEKIEKKKDNQNIIQGQNKNNIKESHSIDNVKLFNNKLNNNDILINKDEINKGKNKRIKIRSVFKMFKKNKILNTFTEKNLSKKEEDKIKEEIRSNIMLTKQEEIRNKKITKILKEDIENFFSFYNMKSDIKDKTKYINYFNNYNLSIIEQLIIKVKVDLIDIINSFLFISNEIIDCKYKLQLCNEYIKLLIEFYSKNYLNITNIRIIHIKILKLLYDIETLNVNNKYKYQIFGYLFYCFLNNKLFTETDLNYFENCRQNLLIEIEKVVKNIISSYSDEKKAKEKFNKFKNTKIFIKNPYFNYVSN